MSSAPKKVPEEVSSVCETSYLLEQQSEPKNITNYSIEFFFVLKNASPLIFTFLLQYSVTVISVFFTGRLGDAELGAGTLSITFFYISGASIVNGFASCLDTLCAQAFGAKNYKLFCLYVQRCVIIMLIMLIPFNLIWWNSYTILGLFVKDKAIVTLASSFLKVLSVGSPALVVFEVSKRFLQSQGIFHATTYVFCISIPTNILLNYLFVMNESTSLGFKGAALALAMTYWLNATLIVLYITFINGSQYWSFVGVSSLFQNWMQLIYIAVPDIIMVLSESLAFQLLTFMAARISSNELSSQSVVSTMASLGFQLPFAMSVCCSTRISHYVGSGEKQNAILATNTAVYCAFFAGMANFAALFFGRYAIAAFFTPNPLTQELIVRTMPIVAVMQLIDCFNVLGAGCLRGQARQKIGSYLSLLSYYVVATPIEVFLGFNMNLGVLGLWGGLSTGVSFLSFSELYALYITDWDKVLVDAKARNEVEGSMEVAN